MSTHCPQPFWGRRRRKNNLWIALSTLSTSKHYITMSLQNTDRQFAQLHAAWLAAQRSAPQLNFTGGFEGFEGPAHGSRYGGFDQFNRSSMVLPSSSGLTPSPTDTVDHVLRLAAQADHELLVRSGNEAYANALALHKGTRAELDSLRYIV